MGGSVLMGRYFWFAILIFLGFFGTATAATAPAYSPNFGSQTSTAIQQKLIQRGFAANDPRFSATLTRVGGSVSTAAAAGGSSWLGVAARLGMGGVAALAIPLAIDYYLKHNGDGTVTLSGAGMGAAPNITDPSAGVSLGGGYWSSTIGGVKGGHPYNVGFQAATNAYIAPGSYYDGIVQFTCIAQSATRHYCEFLGRIRSTQGTASFPVSFYVEWLSSGAPVACPSGSYISSTNTCLAYAFALVNQPVYQSVPVSPQEAIADLPQPALQLALSPDIQSQTIDHLWRNASAQPGYDGIPYDPSYPITSADIPTSPTVTVGDYVGPAVSPSGSVFPNQSPAPVIQPAPGAQNINLGPDPAIPSPTLQEPPTSLEIVQPLLNLFPSLKNFSVPSHSSVCPTGSFSFFGRVHQFDKHCDLFEQFRPAIYGVFLLFWTLAAVKIILEA